METQLETQLPDSGAQIPGNIDQEQPSGMESQQFLPTDPTPATEPATNRASRGRGRPGFVDSAERWTQVVLKKMERSKRTGQACNRCKACFQSFSSTLYLYFQSPWETNYPILI